jgi:hypothetical protein
MLDKCCTTKVCCNDFLFSSISAETVLNKSLVKLFSTSVLIFIDHTTKVEHHQKNENYVQTEPQPIHQFDSPQTAPQTHHDQIASATKGEKDKKCKHNIQLSSSRKIVQTTKSTKGRNKDACIACLQPCSLGFCMFCRKQPCEKKAEKERDRTKSDSF